MYLYMKKIERFISSIAIEQLVLEDANEDKQKIFNNIVQSMNVQENTKKENSSYLFKYKYYLAFAMILLVLIAGVTSFYLNIGGSSGQDVAQTSEVRKSEKINSREKANKRYLAMTGLPYDDYVLANSVQNNSALDVENSIKVEEFDVKPNISKVFYSKSQFEILTDEEYNLFGFDSSKGEKGTIYSSENWTNGYRMKSISRKNGKLTKFFQSSEDGRIEYEGGKYAIKSIWGEGVDYSKFSFASDGAGDLNFAFLDRILETNLIKLIGEEVIDGKTILVYEESYTTERKSGELANPEEAESSENAIDSEVADLPKIVTTDSYKYYADKDTFELIKVEGYEDGKLMGRVTFKETKIYDSIEESGVYSTDEISGIEIKEVIREINKEEKLADIIQKQDIYYFENKPIESYFSYENQTEYDRLSGSVEFDPSLVITNSEREQFYYKDSNKASFYVFSFYPDAYLLEDSTLREIDLPIDGINTKAQLYSTTLNFLGEGYCPISEFGDTETCDPKTAPKEVTFDKIIFEIDGKWVLIEFEGNMGWTEGEGLITLTPEKASQFDANIEMSEIKEQKFIEDASINILEKKEEN